MRRTNHSTFDWLSGLWSGRVDLRLANLAVVCPHPTIYSGKGSIAALSPLNSERLAHDRAATGKNLQVRQGPTAGRSLVAGRGRQRAKSRWRRLVEEGTHRP